MRKILTLLVCFIPVIVIGQTTVKSSEVQNELVKKWLVDLSEKGIDVTDDSLKLSKEFQKVLLDENYRATIYPETYTWEKAVQFIQSQELKKAFWFFINLYPESEKNKELVVKSVLTYDKLFKMDELLINTFYTYCFIDPEVSIIKDGTPEVIHPDILEGKLRNVKEIIGFINYYRNKEKAKNEQYR